MKRFVSICCAFLMLFSMTFKASAIESSNELLDSSVVEPVVVPGDDLIQPHGWGGVAPQVTKIEPYDLGVWGDGSGRIYLTLKVTGYGHGTAFFDGEPVAESKYDYFINYGTTADGFYHRYLLGPLTAGDHIFTVTIKSIAPPYSSLPFTFSFTI